MPKLPVSLALGLALSVLGCMPKGMNEDCRWPPEPHRALDVRRAADARHLVNDVRAAEELGVRYEDSRLRRGAAAPGSPQTRDDCDGRLFAVIAQNHDIALADVHAARQTLDRFGWDPLVHVPLAGVYILLTIGFARAIRHRFSSEEAAAAVFSTVFVSVVLGGLMLGLGQLWDGFVEMARVGNQHLTYRALRLGWRQHSWLVFIAATVSFWVAVLLMYRIPRQQRADTGATFALRNEP